MTNRSAVLNPPESSPDVPDHGPLRRHDVGGRTVHSFETGSTRWLLDLPARRYLEVPRDTALDFRLLLAPWRPFHSVQAEPRSLTIVLDGEERRMVHVRIS